MGGQTPRSTITLTQYISLATSDKMRKEDCLPF